MNGARVLDVSAEFAYVEESGVNDGPGVRMCQAVTGNRPPDPWCASFLSLAIYHAYRGKPPFKLSGGCDELLKAMRAAGLERDKPTVPGVFFVMANPTDAVHTGFVIAVNTNTFFTREGNASPPNQPATREGRQVAERWRPMRPGKYAFCALPGATP